MKNFRDVGGSHVFVLMEYEGNLFIKAYELEEGELYPSTQQIVTAASDPMGRALGYSTGSNQFFYEVKEIPPPLIEPTYVKTDKKIKARR